ncbi:hypothetical protein KH5_00290 [Urechidicola sp. KH5]
MTKKNKPLKKQGTKYLGTGSLIIAFMLFIPYAFYLYRSFPDTDSYETIFGTFESNYYESVRYFIHSFFSKLIPLTLLLVWFTTCKHWWYHSIAIPISVYIFQLISVINDDMEFNDEVEFIYSLPFTIVILTILYFIRSRISLYLKAVDLKEQVDIKVDEKQLHTGEE